MSRPFPRGSVPRWTRNTAPDNDSFALSHAEHSFYFAGGALPDDAPCYVERRGDRDLRTALLAGEFCCVVAPRHMGKSSLMVRTAARLRAEQVRVAVLDLEAMGQTATAGEWYDGLAARLAQELGITDPMRAFWGADESLGPSQRWVAALEQVVLPTCPGRVVLFVDHVEAVRGLAFSVDEFFAGIVEWSERRARDPEFGRLVFCLLGTAMPSDLVAPGQTSPLTRGRRIELEDFTVEEAALLVRGLVAGPAAAPGPGIAAEGAVMSLAHSLLRRVLHWTGGHPYLTQKLCHAAAAIEFKTVANINQLCQELFLSPDAVAQDENLVWVSERLLQLGAPLEAVLRLYAEVLGGRAMAASAAGPEAEILCAVGLLRAVNGVLRLRNQVYERVFNLEWVEAHQPGARSRRRRQALRRAVLHVAVWTAVAGLAAVLILSVQRPLNVERLLPDGSRLTVRKVSFGRNHRCELGHLRFGWLRQVVSPSSTLRAMLDRVSPEFSRSFSEDRLVVWVTRRDAAGKFIDPGLARAMLIDEHGCEFDDAGVGVATKSGVALGNVDFVAVPRRAPEFTLRLNIRDAASVPDFPLPNRESRTHPQWQPAPLPATAQDGGLAVTLTGWRTFRAPLSVPNRAFRVEPQFRMSEHGKPTREWQVENLFLEDITGNSTELTEGRYGLCRFESALKLRVELTRSVRAQFGPAELWTITNVPMAAPGAYLALGQTNTVQGVSLDLVAAFGRGGLTNVSSLLVKLGAPERGQRRVSVAEGGTTISLTVPDQPGVAFVERWTSSGQRLGLRATSADGSDLPITRAGTAGLIRGGMLTFCTVNARPGVETFDLSFIVQRPRQVEFLVKPPAPPAR